MDTQILNPLLLTDGYKTGHHQQYPKGTSLVYSNLTPRTNKHAPIECKELVSFGQQMTMIQIHELFDKDFFNRPKHEVCGEMKRELSMYLNTDYDVSHFEALHDLGYLPIKVKVIEEGTLVPMKVPVLTIVNTHPDFYWITNYLETIISNLLWKPLTSATIAHSYRRLFTEWQQKTDFSNTEFVNWQAHDFSMRGLDSIAVTISSGLGHLTSFSGSDSLPAIFGARKYYNEEGFVCGSVNATEHSVMCAGGKEDEIDTFRRLLETYPTGILSVVSDTWNLWDVITNHLPILKEEILARDGKLVIRPDSGDPVDIVCGHQIQMSHGIKVTSPEAKGVIELLWDVFGGTINSQGYKVLDPHIGAIYGDSITLERAKQIFTRLEAKGFASTNIILGVGSFTYQFNTRDTFGFAMKATYVEVNGEGREIFKDPITDDGIKKSAKGLLRVEKTEDGYKLFDQQTWAEEELSVMKTIYHNGKFENQTTLSKIRANLKPQICVV
jgi:nicotinamide phosphoribosyltransferase